MNAQETVTNAPIATLTDREIAEETLERLRNFDALLDGLVANPMLKMMIPGGLAR